MHVTIPLKVLQSGLKIVAPARASKSPSPILKHVLVRPTKTGISLTCTDLDLTIEHQLDASMLAGFAPFTVDHKSLADWLGLVKGTADVDLSLSETTLCVKVGRAKTELPVMDGEEFPAIHFADGEQYALEHALFTTALRRVMVAKSLGDTSTAAFNGVQFRFSDAGLMLFATTGRHMSWQLLPGAYAAREEVLVGVEHILGIDRDMILRITDGAWSVEAGSTRIGSRLIQATMPPWERMAQMETPIVLTVDRLELHAALSRVLLFASEKDAPSLITMHLEPGKIRLTSQNPSSGQAEEEVSCGYEGGQYASALNGRWFADALAAVDTPTIEWGLQANPTLPMRIQVGAWNYVLCPIRLREKAAA